MAYFLNSNVSFLPSSPLFTLSFMSQKIYPLLKVLPLEHREIVFHKPLLETASKDEPVICFAEDLPDGYRLLNTDEGNDWQIRSEAMRNLSRVRLQWKTFNINDSLSMLTASGNAYSSEKLLDRPFLEEAQEQLDAEEILVAIPRRTVIYATRADNQEKLENFKKVVEITYEDNNYGNAPISPNLFVVRQGEIVRIINNGEQSTDELPQQLAHLSHLGNRQSLSVLEYSYPIAKNEEEKKEVTAYFCHFDPKENLPFHTYSTGLFAKTLMEAKQAGQEVWADKLFDLLIHCPDKDDKVIGDLLRLTGFQLEGNNLMGLARVKINHEGNYRNYMICNPRITPTQFNYINTNTPVHSRLLISITEKEYEWLDEHGNSPLATEAFEEILYHYNIAPQSNFERASILDDPEKLNVAKKVLDYLQNQEGNTFVPASKGFGPAEVIFQKVMERHGSTDPVAAKFNLATRLLVQEEYDESIKVYEEIMASYPDQRSLCLDQIGALNFQLGKYAVAKDFYLKATQEANTPDHTDFNLWEVCELLYKKDSDSKHLTTYLKHFPEGAHVNDALDLMG